MDFTIDDATKLLREAKAPEPWAQPEKLSELAASVVTASEARTTQAPLPDIHDQRRVANKAVAQLREVLPAIIMNLMVVVEAPNLLGEAGLTRDAILVRQTKAKKDRADALRLYKALVDFPTPPQKIAKLLPNGNSPGLHWHLVAALFFLNYRAVVGHASVSRHSPAARFIQLALRAAGYADIELPAIEQALLRSPLTTN
jgi:hypothetical protein